MMYQSCRTCTTDSKLIGIKSISDSDCRSKLQIVCKIKIKLADNRFTYYEFWTVNFVKWSQFGQIGAPKPLSYIQDVTQVKINSTLTFRPTKLPETPPQCRLFSLYCYARGTPPESTQEECHQCQSLTRGAAVHAAVFLVWERERGDMNVDNADIKMLSLVNDSWGRKCIQQVFQA